jgi:hypothetical protein
MAAAATVAVFGLFTWFTPRGQQAAQVASQSAPARNVNSLDAAAGADDPYLEAHFEVSPTIRPSILRANWRPSDER